MASGASNPVLDSQTISAITEKEKQLTGSDDPAKNGPTAQAQKHAGEPLNSATISAITQGEKNVIGDRVKGGPTATAQSILTKSNQAQSSPSTTSTNNGNQTESAADGRLHGATISAIREAESQLTGENQPIRGGPTAQAQKHTGEPLTGKVLSDINAGESKITGQTQPLKGGPTAQAQHDLAKSRE